MSMMMAFSCATRAAHGSRRHISSAAKMPVGATPQLLVSAHGLHNAGAVAKLSSVLYEHGASIAASKKVRLQGRGQASNGNQAVARRQLATT